jgi:hypothetical protein
MDGYEEDLKLKMLKNNLEQKKKIKYKKDSNDRLKKIARKKIQTTMIGALDTVEKHLGFLWENDSKMRVIYETVRQEILDRGNNQMRNLDSEIEQYDVEWLRYNLLLPVKRSN